MRVVIGLIVAGALVWFAWTQLSPEPAAPPAVEPAAVETPPREEAVVDASEQPQPDSEAARDHQRDPQRHGRKVDPRVYTRQRKTERASDGQNDRRKQADLQGDAGIIAQKQTETWRGTERWSSGKDQQQQNPAFRKPGQARQSNHYEAGGWQEDQDDPCQANCARGPREIAHHLSDIQPRDRKPQHQRHERRKERSQQGRDRGHQRHRHHPDQRARQAHAVRAGLPGDVDRRWPRAGEVPALAHGVAKHALDPGVLLTLLCVGCGAVVAVAAMINLNALGEGLLDP